MLDVFAQIHVGEIHVDVGNNRHPIMLITENDQNRSSLVSCYFAHPQLLGISLSQPISLSLSRPPPPSFAGHFEFLIPDVDMTVQV